MSKGIEAFKCSNCDAPLAVSPDDAVITCNFCGNTVTIEGQKISKHFVLTPTIGSGEVQDKVRKWVGRGGGARVTEAQLRFVPYWVESMNAATRFQGYKRHEDTEYYTDSSGRRRSKTVVTYEPIDGRLNEDRSLNILGRRGAMFYSFDEMDKALKVTKRDITPFKFSTITRVEKRPVFLNSELSDEDAFEIAQTMVSEEHRSRAESGATKIWDCKTNIRKLGAYLLHVPHWMVRYQFGSETYRVGIDGHTKRVLKGEVPISTGFRAGMFLLSIIGLVVGSVGAQFIYWMLVGSGLEALAFVLIIVGLLIACIGTQQSFKISSEKRE
ncbi:MAG: hypothetical protein ACFFCO_06280 [Promethearchaeota archaeon]